MPIFVRKSLICILLAAGVVGGVLAVQRATHYTAPVAFAYEPQDPVPGPADMLAELRAFRERLAAADFARRPFAPFLRPYIEMLYRNGPGIYAPVDGNARELIETLFETRLLLRDKLAAFHASGGTLDADSLLAIRDTFRLGRYIEDYIGSEYLKEPGHGVLQGGAPSVLVNPRHRQDAVGAGLELRSGDLLVSRGNAVTSAAIARLSLPPGQFSHLAVVYRKPGSDTLHTVEAHIEIGSVVEPLDKYLTDGKVRAMLFRHPDAGLAHRAAAVMAERIEKASAQTGNVPYDFALDNREDAALFCSEIAYWGFTLASAGRVLLPLYASQLDPRVVPFHRSIGIHVSEAFLPVDLELDTRFELIGEWRDFARIRNAHERDAVLSGIYRWMAERDYRLHASRRSRVLSLTVYPLRKVPLVGSWLLGDKFPPYMGKAVFRTIVTLEDACGALEEQLAQIEVQVAASRGVGLTLPEAMSALERIRAHDETAFERGGRTAFHHYLRP